jgi:ABC-type xylose transport system permease subunit
MFHRDLVKNVALTLIAAGIPDIVQNFRSSEKRIEIHTRKAMAMVAKVIAIDIFALGLFSQITPSKNVFWAIVVFLLVVMEIYKSMFAEEKKK